MKLCKLLIILVLIPAPLSALTLEQMQTAALENRALVRRYEAEIEKSLEDIRIARSNYYPAFDLRYSAYTLKEPTLTEQRENSAFSSIVSWNLFSGFKDRYSVSSAETLNQVEQFRLQAIEQDIQLLVAQRYLAVYNQKARLKVAEDTFKTLEGLYLDSKNRLEVGLLDKNAVLKFKVDYDNASLGVKKERADLEKSIYQLIREIGQDVTLDDLLFEEFNKPPVISDQGSYEQRMLERRSELKALEGLAQASAYRANAAQGDYYPSVDLVGRYRAYEDSLLNDGRGDYSDEELRAELMLSYNLFNGFKDEAEIARAKADVRSLKYDLKELQSTFSTELKNLFVDYAISLANVEVARLDISSAEENLRITQLKYKEGLQSQLDLLDAVSNLTRAQSNYVNVVRTVFSNYFSIVRMVEEFPGRQQNRVAKTPQEN